MIRCLVADDSPTFRAILRAILARAREIEVVGEAPDGAAAVRQVLALRPDVVTMDVRMPGMDGLAAIAEIMRVAPTPVVVVSAEAGAENQQLSFRALELGAVEVLAKPRAVAPGQLERDAEAIRLAVRAVAGLRLVTRRARRTTAPISPAPAEPSQARGDALGAARVGKRDQGPARAAIAAGALAPRVIGIAASTGGPPALAQILRALPAGYPIPILVVQHIAVGFEAGLVHWLDGVTPLTVKLAVDGEPLRPATVYLAPAHAHLVVSGGATRIVEGEPVGGFRPSGTVLLDALARAYGPAAAGLVLSGMGADGADGLRALRDRGGWTAAQGPTSSVVYGMPRVALERGGAVVTLELEEIPAALLRLARLREAHP